MLGKWLMLGAYITAYSPPGVPALEAFEPLFPPGKYNQFTLCQGSNLSIPNTFYKGNYMYSLEGLICCS
jgi:hypothetical protein